MNASDLKNLCAEARPIIERMMDDSETLAAFRETATNRGIDWSQVKALLKAQIRDERDGGDGKRVRALVEKADHATAYADMLGFTQNNISRSSSEARSATGKAPEAAPLEQVSASRRGQEPLGDQYLPNAPDDLEIPDFLRRSREVA